MGCGSTSFRTARPPQREVVGEKTHAGCNSSSFLELPMGCGSTSFRTARPPQREVVGEKIHRPSSRPPSSHTPSFSIHCLPPSSVVWRSRILPVPTFVRSCPRSSYRIALCLSRSTRYVHGALAPSERPEEHAHTPIRGSRSEGRAPAACLPLQGHYPNSAERGMAQSERRPRSGSPRQ